MPGMAWALSQEALGLGGGGSAKGTGPEWQCSVGSTARGVYHRFESMGTGGGGSERTSWRR